MIKSKTYNTTAGLNYIEAPELVLTTIYAVKRNGSQYDKYISGSPDRTYTYNASLGRIYFPVSFTDDRVFVIYEQKSTVVDPIPGVCNPIVIPALSMPDGLVGVPYSQSLLLSGSEPFDFSITSSPAWMTISLSGNIISMSGTPDVEGTETIQFDVSNCDGANNETFSDTIDIIDDTTNFYISNLSTSGVKITKVIPGMWIIQTGSFPIHYLAGITGAHNGFTANLSVFITGIVFPFQLSLIKNGVVLQSFTVDVDDVYEFDEQTFINTDQVQIVLN